MFSTFALAMYIRLINDMPNEMNCNIQLFADDTKIFKTVDNEEDHQDLAKDWITWRTGQDCGR